MNKLSKAMKDRFLTLACALSPENISWDGERPKADIARERACLLAQWRALENKVGRPVTEMEVWQFACSANDLMRRADAAVENVLGEDSLLGFAPVNDPVVKAVVLAHRQVYVSDGYSQYVTWYYNDGDQAVYEGCYFPYRNDNEEDRRAAYDDAVKSFVRRTLNLNRIATGALPCSGG